MPTTQIVQHTNSVADKQLVADVLSAYEPIREAEKRKEEAAIQSLRARYEWGREVRSALEVTDDPKGLRKDISAKLDRTEKWVRDHERWSQKCETRFETFDPPVEGYIADCHDMDRRLVWRSAVSWMQDSKETDPKTEINKQQRKVERQLESLEDESEKLAEQYNAHSDDLDEDARRQVEGVLTRAKQALEDETNILDELPDEAPERIEVEGYRQWVADHACVACGLDDETTIAHHYRPAVETGTATKPDDWYTVPLCFDDHQECEEAEDEREWWKKHGIDAMEEIAHLQADFLSRAMVTYA